MNIFNEKFMRFHGILGIPEILKIKVPDIQKLKNSNVLKVALDISTTNSKIALNRITKLYCIFRHVIPLHNIMSYDAK